MHPNLILTANPDFADLALGELKQACTKSQIVSLLADGVWAIHCPRGFIELAETWRKFPPIFVRHISPIHHTLPLKNEHKDVTILERTVKAEFAELVEPDWSFAVQARLLDSVPYRKYSVNATLSDAIERMTGAMLDTRNPEQILSVVIANQTAYLGLSLAIHNLSNWAGGMHHFAREEGQISRAEFKLLEALTVFNVTLPPNGVCLDLGAAPGGWTRVLRQREQYVTAVDPGQLHPTLQADRNVRHKQMTAEDYLENDPDQFDLIVNDMRMDARDSARLMVQYGRCLYRPHGIIIMTFKLPEEKRHIPLDHAFNILRPSFNILGARQLFHNRSEITVYLQPIKQTLIS